MLVPKSQIGRFLILRFLAAFCFGPLGGIDEQPLRSYGVIEG